MSNPDNINTLYNRSTYLPNYIYPHYYDGGGWFTKLWNSVFGSSSKEENNNRKETTTNKKEVTLQLKKRNVAPPKSRLSPFEGRVHTNDSPTRDASEKIESTAAWNMKNLNDYAQNERGVITPDNYYIPYIDSKEVVIPGVGRVSTNALDSIAVNAERANTPLRDALGLASYETKFGAVPNVSIDGFKKGFKSVYGREPTEEEIKGRNRAMLNASYMRNYGGIYPQYLVNDHEWSMRGYRGSKYGKELDNIASPLLHAFTLYNKGLYNTGNSNHTAIIQKEGDRLMELPVIQLWLKEYKSNTGKQ